MSKKMACGLHYITATPGKFIDAFKRREKREEKKLEEEKRSNEWLSLFLEKFADALKRSEEGKEKKTEENGCGQERMILPLARPEELDYRNASLEQVILFLRDGIVSVLPDTKTAWQKDRWSWAGLNTKSNGLGQKEGVLVCYKWLKDDLSFEICFDFWLHGECVISYDKVFDRSLPEFLDVLEQYFHCNREQAKQAMEADDECVMLSQLEQCLGFPLFIPADWEDRWSPKRLTPHLLLVEQERNGAD